MNSYKFTINDKVEINITVGSNDLDLVQFEKKLEDPLIQFILLAAVQNKGSVRLSNILFWVNRIYENVQSIGWKRQAVLDSLGKYNRQTRVFEIDLDLFERYKHLITYDKPVKSDVSIYHGAYILLKVFALTIGFVFWRDVTIAILVLYLFFKLFNALNKS
jgi:hypothetical protein